MRKIKSFIKKEIVLCIAAICAAATMFIVPPNAEYIEYIDLRVLCLLFCLMAVVALFKNAGAFEWLTCTLLRRIKNGRALGVTLVLLPFFTSMLVTNDVALLVFVPFTLLFLMQLDCTRAAVGVLVLQTIAANLGSMATPVGNPQNLFLYAYYELGALDFFSVTLPLTAFSLLLLTVAALPLLPRTLPQPSLKEAHIKDRKMLALYAALFILSLLTVFRIVPYLLTTLIIAVFLLLFDRRRFAEIDFLLLFTFVCFFIVSENLGRVETVRQLLQSLLGRSTLLTAVGASQVISNVPAAVLLAPFTARWRELLAGVNIGGLGTPIASLASLITLKLYLRWEGARVWKFLGVFSAANIAFLLFLLVFSTVI